MMSTTHRFMVYTHTNPEGDDVGAEDVKILNSGALTFFNGGRVDVAYSPNEWRSMEYGYEEEGAN